MIAHWLMKVRGAHIAARGRPCLDILLNFCESKKNYVFFFNNAVFTIQIQRFALPIERFTFQIQLYERFIKFFAKVINGIHYYKFS